MNNEPALCPKCHKFSLIRQVTFGSHLTKGYCTDKDCGYDIDRINRVETKLRAVSPPRPKDKEAWYAKSEESLHRLSMRGQKRAVHE